MYVLARRLKIKLKLIFGISILERYEEDFGFCYLLFFFMFYKEEKKR